MNNKNFLPHAICVMLLVFVLFTGIASVSLASDVAVENTDALVQSGDAAENEGTLLSAESFPSAKSVGNESVTPQAAAKTNDSSSGKIGKWIDKTFYNFDWKIFSFFGSIQNKILNGFFKVVTNFGDSLFTIPVLLAGIVMTLFKKTRKYGFALVFAIIIGTLLTNCIFKVVCARARPYVTLAETGDYSKWYAFVGSPSESDNSFPSGHTTAAMEMAVVLFMTFGKKGNRFRWIFPVIGLLVPVSRVYLMVHYPTDVIAGIFIGSLAAIIAYYIMKAVMRTLAKDDRRNDFDLARKLRKKA